MEREPFVKGTINLTEGSIRKQLFQLTIPIIATNLIQTTYQMVDMIWLGRVGSEAVTAVGTAGFYFNLAMALFTLISIGTGVKIAHSLGASAEEEANQFLINSFLLASFLAFIYVIVLVFSRHWLISIFGINDSIIENLAADYLLVSIVGIFFSFYNGLFIVSLTSKGNSQLAFRISSVGFIVNMVLDPLFIFGIGPINGLGVLGAALATVIANGIVTMMFFNKTQLHHRMRERFSFDLGKSLLVLKMGLPITIQRVTFIIIAIVMAIIIARFGSEGIAVQRIGVQIEAISFMTIGGLQGAIAAFIGQNYGAGKWDRVSKGYWQALFLTICFGLIITSIFIFFPHQLFRIFIQDEAIVEAGIYYMRIVGLSQVFMCMELLTVGAFNGIGKTYIPPIFSIIFTALRIPLAIWLSSPDLFGINGVWISISFTSILKGIILVSWYGLLMKRTVRGVQHENK